MRKIRTIQGGCLQILEALGRIVETRPVVLPLHPRTRNAIHGYGLGDRLNKIMVTDPLPYLDIVALEQCAHTIVTDSGGVQKEAFFYGVPCVTVRSETEVDRNRRFRVEYDRRC